jgi:outer membrane protein OmpA-like peptidoglycan-associated protein
MNHEKNNTAQFMATADIRTASRLRIRPQIAKGHYLARVSLIMFLLLLFPVGELFSQKFLNEGNKYFNRNLFEEAIPLYLKEIEKGSAKAKPEAREKLASCYRLTGRFLEANEMYKLILDKSQKTNKPENVLHYANSLKASARYAEAAEQFENYIKLMPNDPMGKVYLESCTMAQAWLDQPEESTVNNLEQINTDRSDFSPVFYKDGILFTSDRDGSTRKFISVSGAVNETMTDLWYVDLVHLNKEVPEIVNFTGLNSDSHDGTATFTPDQKRVYFTRTIIGKKNKKTNLVLNSLQVFFSDINSKGEWSEPVSAFSFNSPNYSVGQPCLSQDGKRMYFFSDMPGGKGKTDIYYTDLQADGKWGKPVNLGEPVNTFGEELFPYIRGNDTLYFSSDTHPGMGKLDIFYATRKDGSWGNITNMKPPVNSIGDDFGITLSKNQDFGFFSSDRFNGKGKEDILTFYKGGAQLLQFVGYKLQIPDRTLYNGITYKIAEEGKQESVALEAANGFYSFMLKENKSYNLTLRKSGFFYDLINIRLSKDPLKEYFKAEISSQNWPVLIGGLLAEQSYKIQPSTVKESGKNAVARPDTIIELKPLPEVAIVLRENLSDVQVAITNAKGFYSLSDTLAKGRLYTVHALIDSEGYIAGKSNPKETKSNVPARVVAPVSVSGVIRDVSTKKILADCSVKIIKDAENIFETTSNAKGLFKIQLPGETSFEVIVTKKGYFQKNTAFFSDKPVSDANPLEILLAPLETNKTVELKNILFDYNKADLRPESIVELDKLKDFLTINQDILIELNAHTDTRGEYYFNIQLSEKRAENVKRYLSGHGISQNRIVTHGYGETFPVVADARTEADHAKNRRVEFSIIDSKVAESQGAALPAALKGITSFPKSPYTAKYPFPEVTQLQPGVSYRLKIAESATPLPFDTFKGLFPVAVAKDKASNKYVYYAGYFATLREAEEGTEFVRNKFFRESEIIAYKDNDQITIKESQELARLLGAGVSNNAPGQEAAPSGDALPYFSVQVAAFKGNVSASAVSKFEAMASDYTLIRLKIDESTVFSIGRFATYEEAYAGKAKIADTKKVKDTFIIAVYNGKKIPINEANRMIKK